METEGAEISTHKDEGGFERLEVQLKGAMVGIEVITADGETLCSLNIFDFMEGAGGVDVILPEDKGGRFISFNNGVQHTFEPPGDSVTIYAVDFKPK